MHAPIPALSLDESNFGIAVHDPRRDDAARAETQGEAHARRYHTHAARTTEPSTSPDRNTGTSVEVSSGVSRRVSVADELISSQYSSSCRSCAFVATTKVPTLREKRLLDKTRRWILKEAAAGASQGAHLLRAVSLHEQRGRASRGVVSGLRLAFQHTTRECRASQ